MSKRAHQSIIFRITLAALVIGGLAGCIKSGANSNTNTATAVTYVSVMNLAPYSPSTEVYLNGAKQTVAIPPGNYSTAYAHLPPGAYDVKFKVAGGDSVLAAIGASSYDSIGFYTLILYNTAVNGPAQAIRVYDDFQNVSVSNGFYRFFNMCPELPSVDLYLNGTKTEVGRTPADIVGSSVNTSFRMVDPVTYSVVVKKAGTDSVVANLSNISLAAGNAYTIFLGGSSTNATDPISLSVLRAAY